MTRLHWPALLACATLALPAATPSLIAQSSASQSTASQSTIALSTNAADRGMTAVGDTSGAPFPFALFADAVLANHPVARQAQAVAEQARAELRQAWGAFDPTVTATWDRKTFGGTQYFNYVDAALKIPLPIGADVTVAFDRTLGRYANPDRLTPGNGTLSAGVSIPLGQRIITDERRTALQQARAARDLGEADRTGLVNKLLFSAAKEYGTWYESWRRRAIALEGEALADFRLRAVRQRVRNGESAPIDTIEALLEVQRRQVTRFEAEAGFYVATLGITAFLWDSTGAPRPLPAEAKPTIDGLGNAVIDSTRLDALLAVAVRRHPELLKVQAKVRQAEAERLLATQGLLPFAEAKLEALGSRDSETGFFDRARVEDNYKSALAVKTPLLFLKETGKFGATGQKLTMQRLEADRLRRDVELESRAAMFELSNLERLLLRQRENVRYARLLRDAEQIRFENGESTLLILNLRERLVLDEATKLAALEGKVAGARGALALATGDRTLLSIGR